jgi:glutathione synthase/RimK-type ligase-like ATP-grasp enzyme
VRDVRCLGISRERAHSPGREFDDAEILRMTAKHLEAKGFQVDLRSPDEVSGMVDQPPPFVFLMCERPSILDQLRRWEMDGALQVNSPVAVLNTYRDRMVFLIEEATIPFPPSVFVSTTSVDHDVSGPVWVKRADVHNTQEGDVVFASSGAQAREALRNLAGRGIPRAVIQEHVPGDLIKFYGVGDPDGLPGRERWFQWFYHKDQHVAGYPFDAKMLAMLTQRAAAALGLEVYGGDAIAGQDGRLLLIDLNAWPSFALYRDEASARIAAYLERRFSRGLA